jgi:hypothetical protein
MSDQLFCYKLVKLANGKTVTLRVPYKPGDPDGELLAITPNTPEHLRNGVGGNNKVEQLLAKTLAARAALETRERPEEPPEVQTPKRLIEP